MAVLLSIFASDILPIFLIASVGFLLARHVDASVKTMAHVVFYALIPSLVFNLLVASKMTGLQFGRMALAAILVTLGMGVVGRVVTLPFRMSRPELSAFLLVVMFSNTGNFGLPVVLFAFGDVALSHGTAYFVTSSIITYTVGVFLAAAGTRSVRRALTGIVKVPAMYSAAAAAVVLMTGRQVPLAIERPIGLLSNAALPMMIVVLGMQLERATLPDRPWLVVLAVVVSLAVAPAVALGVAPLLGLAGPARQAAVIIAAMPAAVVTTILALEFDVAPTFVTSTVFVSTLASPFTLTPLIAFLRR